MVPNFFALGARLSQPRSPLVVILDFHGLLLSRIRNTTRGQLHRTLHHRRPWFTTHRHSLWLRPYVGYFLRCILSRHTVALWTSAQPRNIEPLLARMSTSLHISPPLQDCLTFIWYRSDCRPDLDTGPYSSIKFLPDVWEDESLKRFCRPENTILLDDSMSKVRYFPASAVVVPEYSVEVMGEYFNEDDTLLWMLLYLEYLIECGTSQVGLNLPFGRNGSMSLWQFINLGEEVAWESTTPQQRRSLLSPAQVFIGRDIFSPESPPSFSDNRVMDARARNISAPANGPVSSGASSHVADNIMIDARTRDISAHANDPVSSGASRQIVDDRLIDVSTRDYSAHANETVSSGASRHIVDDEMIDARAEDISGLANGPVSSGSSKHVADDRMIDARTTDISMLANGSVSLGASKHVTGIRLIDARTRDISALANGPVSSGTSNHASPKFKQGVKECEHNGQALPISTTTDKATDIEARIVPTVTIQR